MRPVSKVWIECEIVPFPDPDMDSIMKNFVDVHFDKLSIDIFLDDSASLRRFRVYQNDLGIEVSAFYLNPCSENEKIGGHYAIK